MDHIPLTREALRRRTAPETLGFETTQSLEPVDGLVGQDRALNALKFGVGMEAYGYNIYALGTQGSGRHKAVRRFVEARAREQDAPNDWLYVYNFDEPHRPRAVSLPAGKGAAFCAACDRLIEQLKTGLRAVFESEDYQLRQQSIGQEFAQAQQAIFQEMSAKAEAQGLRLVPQ
ncbi:MAG: Lon-like protease helical domain-containing protein, partial [Pseudomonadota bacterium]